MRGCVIGAGPSGLYAAKYLAAQGIPVSVYEKSGKTMGNYRYARARGQKLDSILDSKGIDLHLSTDASQINDQECGFYVVASGGTPRALDIPGGGLSVQGMHVIEQHYNGQRPGLGEKVCIVGMGNVAFDIAGYIRDYCKDITIFSNKNVADSPFDNHVLRETLDSNKWNISLQNASPGVKNENKDRSEPTPAASRRAASRGRLLERVIGSRWSTFKDYFFSRKPRLNLRFGVRVEELRKKDQKVEVTFSSKNGLFQETFDSVVSSIGFVPNKPAINTKKPVFHTGWCVNAHGNIDDAMRNAKMVVDGVLEELCGKKT